MRLGQYSMPIQRPPAPVPARPVITRFLMTHSLNGRFHFGSFPTLRFATTVENKLVTKKRTEQQLRRTGGGLKQVNDAERVMDRIGAVAAQSGELPPIYK